MVPGPGVLTRWRLPVAAMVASFAVVLVIGLVVGQTGQPVPAAITTPATTAAPTSTAPTSMAPTSAAPTSTATGAPRGQGASTGTPSPGPGAPTAPTAAAAQVSVRGADGRQTPQALAELLKGPTPPAVSVVDNMALSPGKIAPSGEVTFETADVTGHQICITPPPADTTPTGGGQQGQPWTFVHKDRFTPVAGFPGVVCSAPVSAVPFLIELKWVQ